MYMSDVLLKLPLAMARAGMAVAAMAEQVA